MKFSDAHGVMLDPDKHGVELDEADARIDSTLESALASIAPAEASLAARALIVAPLRQASAEARRLARFYLETATLIDAQADDLESRR